MISLKIGDSVWVFDENRRIYDNGRSAAFNHPIWREHWVKHHIIGENKATFFLVHASVIFSLPVFDPKNVRAYGKLKKLDLKAGKTKGFAFSKKDVDRRTWMHENIYNLTEQLRRCTDFEKVAKVALLLAPELVEANLFEDN